MQGCRLPAPVLYLSAVPILPHSTQAAFTLHSPGSVGKNVSPGLSPEGDKPFSLKMKASRRMTVLDQPFLSTCFMPAHSRALWGFCTAAIRALPSPTAHT